MVVFLYHHTIILTPGSVHVVSNSNMAERTIPTKDNDDPWKTKNEAELDLDLYKKYLDNAGKLILFQINIFLYIDFICIFKIGIGPHATHFRLRGLNKYTC